ncbi:hypothetical protein [Virgibacillus sp. CBA3643]|uniref:hypothetical protein n=1 Tax=Virgibacillus sp. CBA3643 TaxID=2942278 RepID=UPI0035A272FA
MIKTYECINSFLVGIVDGDGFFTEEDILVKEGTTWAFDEDEHNNTDYHLERDEEVHDDGSITLHYIEIDQDTLENNFKEIK